MKTVGTVFFDALSKSACLVINRDGKRTAKAMRFEHPSEALNWCIDNRYTFTMLQGVDATSKTKKQSRQRFELILVSLPEWRAQRFRALAQCHSSGVQGALRDAVLDKMAWLEQELGIKADQAVQMSKLKRAAVRRRFIRLQHEIIGGGSQ